MKKGKFKLDIYSFEINVVIVENPKSTVEFYYDLRKKLKLEFEELGLSEGFCYLYRGKLWLVFSENRLSYNLITHECFHATMQILNFNNIEVCEDDENAALLNGFINEKVFKTIHKLNCKII